MFKILRFTTKATYSCFLCIVLLANLAYAQSPTPAVEWTSLFKMDMYPTGYFNIRDLDLAFVPEGAAVKTEVKSTSGETVLIFDALSTTPKVTSNVFSRYQMSGSSNDKLKPGDYLLETTVNDTLANRMAFTVYQESSDDPFATNDKVHFSGDWQKLGYLDFITSSHIIPGGDARAMSLRLWIGLSDMPDGERSDQAVATLYRDKTIIGHTKETGASLEANSEINGVDIMIFGPHERNEEANVVGIAQADLVAGDHDYQITITRKSDGAVLRDFSFQSKDGALVALPRSALGYTPAHDYLPSRAQDRSSTVYEFQPVHWLQNQ